MRKACGRQWTSMTLMACLLSGLACAGWSAESRHAFAGITRPANDVSVRQVTVYTVPALDATYRGPGRNDASPTWSPDGTALAFSSSLETGAAVFVTDLAGATRPLASAHESCLNPVWSPEGGLIAYDAGEAPGVARHIYTQSPTGGDERRWGADLEARPEVLGLTRPVWLNSRFLLGALEELKDLSEFGVDVDALRREAEETLPVVATGYVQTRDGLSTELFVLTRTQTVPLLPVVAPDSIRYAEWNAAVSPGGSQIAFESNDGADREIFVVNRRGYSDLSNHRSADWNPRWTPDGEWVLFESMRGGRQGVYRIEPDTARIEPEVISATHDVRDAAWSPELRWRMHTQSGRGETAHVLSNADGERVGLLPEDTVLLGPVAWRPIAKDDG